MAASLLALTVTGGLEMSSSHMLDRCGHQPSDLHTPSAYLQQQEQQPLPQRQQQRLGHSPTPSSSSAASPTTTSSTAASPTPASSTELVPSARQRNSRVISGHELSPLKILSEAAGTAGDVRNPRKRTSPEKRFPVRISSIPPQALELAQTFASTLLVEEEETGEAKMADEDEAKQEAEEARTQTWDRERQREWQQQKREEAEEEEYAGLMVAPAATLEPGTLEQPDTLEPGTLEPGLSLEQAMRQNSGLMTELEIFEDADDNDNTATAIAVEAERTMDPDDTMASTFSSFSAVPSLTMFAKAGSAQSQTPSPSRLSHYHVSSAPVAAPVAAPPATPHPSDGRLGSPAKTARAVPSDNNSTNLLDFTDNVRLHASPAGRSPAKAAGSANTHKRLSVHGSSFGKNSGRPTSTPSPLRSQYGGSTSPPSAAAVMGSLLDFDIPPLPTPRSIPSVTPRQLESLKSSFLSEISGLRASLSGKEAEVHSLKAAIGDAERRAGESLEAVREQRSRRERLEADRDEWERRGRDMDAMLRKVRDEILLGRRDREELEAKLDESEKRREAAEMMAQEAESKMAGMRAGEAAAAASVASAAAASAGESVAPPVASVVPPSLSAAATGREVEQAVQRMARELHTLYKSKHETKVAALKKSYEARFLKRVRTLEALVGDLDHENDRLRLGRDSCDDPAAVAKAQAETVKAEAAVAEQTAGQAARLRELTACVHRLEAEADSVRADNAALRGMLERERVEKGELVQLAEEMMAMQSFVATPAPAVTSSIPPVARATVARPPTMPAASGIRAPGSAPKRRSLLAPPSRSGIMSSIERMGSYGRRG